MIHTEQILPGKKTGGLIAAAGRSSRMGALKPLLPLGDETLLRRGILTFLAAGVSPIVIVTGREARAVEESVADLPVECVRNPDYQTTQMLDSIRLGLKRLQGRCERVVFAPADAPLYSMDTVRTVAESEAPVCVPEHQGTFGHPAAFDAELIPRILSYEGPGGLAGALDSLGGRCPVPCPDPGAYMDADTPDDYERLKAYYEQITGKQDAYDPSDPS